MNEPVAYMDKNGYVYGKHETRPIEADIPLYEYPPIAFAELEEGQSIPLYEHPETLEDRESAIYATGYWNGIAYKKLRELTDEKIKQIFRDESGFEIDTCPIAILDFARAIESYLKGEK